MVLPLSRLGACGASALAGTIVGMVTTQKTPSPSTAAITAKTASFRNTEASLGRAWAMNVIAGRDVLFLDRAGRSNYTWTAASDNSGSAGSDWGSSRLASTVGSAAVRTIIVSVRPRIATSVRVSASGAMPAVLQTSSDSTALQSRLLVRSCSRAATLTESPSAVNTV